MANPFTNALRQNSILEITIQGGYHFKLVESIWDGEKSWYSLSDIQEHIATATQTDIDVLVAKGKLQTSPLGFANTL
jgi:hypothetical protein